MITETTKPTVIWEDITSVIAYSSYKVQIYTSVQFFASMWSISMHTGFRYNRMESLTCTRLSDKTC